MRFSMCLSSVFFVLSGSELRSMVACIIRESTEHVSKKNSSVHLRVSVALSFSVLFEKPTL